MPCITLIQAQALDRHKGLKLFRVKSIEMYFIMDYKRLKDFVSISPVIFLLSLVDMVPPDLTLQKSSISSSSS